MKKLLISIVLTAAACMLFAASLPSYDIFAYYNRGKVKIESLGTENLTIEEGKTANITISVSPLSYTGNIGCGMAECPQMCGGMCGDEVNGQCQCVGDEKMTAYTEINVSTDNASAAVASYSNGVISIDAKKSGDAVISINASLWQHTNSDTKTINVTVVKSKASETASTETAEQTQPIITDEESDYEDAEREETIAVYPQVTSPAVSESESGNDESDALVDDSENITDEDAVKESGSNASDDSEASDKNEADGNSKIINSVMNGKVKIVNLNGASLTGMSDMLDAMENGLRLVFQKLDNSQNVEYSWTFQAEDLKNPADIDMGIEIKENPPDGFNEDYLKNPMYVSFNHEGELPGKATIYLNIGNHFDDDDILALYYFNSEQKSVQMVEKNITVSSGYVTFTVEHCSEYAIALYETESVKPIGKIVIISVICALALASVVIIYIYHSIKIRKRLGV